MGSHPQSIPPVKADPFFAPSYGTAEQAAEKLFELGDRANESAAGAEALVDFVGFSARLKVVPCYKAPSGEFFRKL